MKTKIIGALLGAFLLAGCTLGDLADARSTLKAAGTAGKEYFREHIVTRREYRLGIKNAIRAEYNFHMIAAELAARGGKTGEAKAHWKAARKLYAENMPLLKDLKTRIGDFLGDD